jgi:hypothetical protein
VYFAILGLFKNSKMAIKKLKILKEQISLTIFLFLVNFVLILSYLIIFLVLQQLYGARKIIIQR